MKRKALAQVRTLTRGNGVEKDSIHIIKENSSTVNCEAITHLELNHETLEKQQKGQHQIGDVIESAAALPKIIDKLSTDALKNTDMRKAMANMLLSRSDKGFSIHAEEFEIEPLSKEFCYFQPCEPCQGHKKTTCPACNGQKIMQCNKCYGRTTISCNFCHGNGITRGSDGVEKQCNRCFGKRSIKCTHCQSRGSITCRKCNGTGDTKCSTCGGVGVFTHMIKVFFKIKTLFEIDRASLPHPAVKIIEDKGSKLVKDGHIKIQGEPVKREDGGLAIQYNVQFPYTALDIGINGKPFKIHMFGFKAKMLKVSNFLNQLIEKNYALLIRAANNDGNVVAHIRKASKTRMIGEGLLFSVTMRPKKAMMALKKKFPIGASNELIKDIIVQSNKALINISRKSHFTGLAIGLVITAIINAAYFFLPVRHIVSGLLGETIALTAIDFSLILLGGGITMMLSKYMAASPLKKALSPLMSDQQHTTFKPINHNSQWPAFAGSVVIFIIMVALTTITSAVTLHWIGF